MWILSRLRPVPVEEGGWGAGLEEAEWVRERAGLGAASESFEVRSTATCR